MFSRRFYYSRGKYMRIDGKWPEDVAVSVANFELTPISRFTLFVRFPRMFGPVTRWCRASLTYFPVPLAKHRPIAFQPIELHLIWNFTATKTCHLRTNITDFQHVQTCFDVTLIRFCKVSDVATGRSASSNGGYSNHTTEFDSLCPGRTHCSVL